MQHIENQMPESQVNSIKMKEKWKKISQNITEEQLQRSGEISQCLEGLEDRIFKNNLIEESKSKIILAEIQRLRKNAQEVRQISIQGPSKENQVRTAYEHKTSNYIRQYQEKADQSNKSVSENTNKKMAEITMTYTKNNRIFMKNSEDTVADIKKQTKILSEIISLEKDNRQKALLNIKEEINKQVGKINDCTAQIRQSKIQSEIKLEEMVKELENLISNSVNEQIKNGQTTYDCLMKLFQDTCSKMQQNLLK